MVLPAEQFEDLVARRRQPKSLLDFFRASPLVGADVDFEREADFGREFEL